MKTQSLGKAFVLFALIVWGLSPAFWALLAGEAPLVVLFHRVAWSLLILTCLLALKSELASALSLLRRPEIRKSILFSAFMMGANWLTYIWAMGSGEYVSASLGYTICPLVTICFGAYFLGEKLKPGQRIACAFVFLGLAAIMLAYSVFPLVALLLAFTWSSYTLLKKGQSAPVLHTLFLEACLLTPAIALLAISNDSVAFYESVHLTDSLALLFVAGLITVIPQTAMVEGVKRVPLQFVGVAQYLVPALMLMQSVLFLGERPSEATALSLGIAALGVLLYFSADFLLERLIPRRGVRAQVVFE